MGTTTHKIMSERGEHDITSHEHWPTIWEKSSITLRAHKLMPLHILYISLTILLEWNQTRGLQFS